MKLSQRLAQPSRIVVVLIAILGSIALPGLIQATPAAADGTGTTVTGGYAWSWDPNDLTDPGQLYGSPRTVTVDQTTDLVSQVVHVSWSNFSASSATSALSNPLYPVRVYECDSATPADPSHCFGSQTYPASHPGYGDTGGSNLVGAVTGADGTGGIDFPVLTGADNPSLGCSPSHACSLLIEPYAGGDSVGKDADGNVGLGDPSHPTPDCDNHSLDFTVDPNTYVGNLAQPGGGLSDWDAGCAWAARIVVPLHFAPTPTDCPQRDADFRTEGSPLLQRAIDQWRAGICRAANGGRPLQVGYSPLSEYQARNDFQAGTTDVALTSQPSSNSVRPSTYAPIGVSSIDIAYYVDNAITGKPITDLRLNARLLAKMLTQSYSSGLSANCADKTQFYACAPEVTGNPSSLFTDPEFLALNPAHTAADFPVASAASFPTVMFGDSDQTYQLTRWIESDPDAAAFLNGQRDDWGMRVNSAYLPPNAPAYPISQFTANDQGHTLTVPNCDGPNACLNAGLQNTWFPVAGLRNVAKTLLAGKDSGKAFSTSCQANNVPAAKGVCQYYAADPASPQGARGAFAVVAGGDAAAYRFPTAQLQTSSGGFVSDSTASVSAALADMRTNPDKVTQQLNYAALTDAKAYPLTAVAYAQVPTCGLSPAKATAVANFLRYTASPAGNVYGVGPGQLSPGYLALPGRLSQQATTTADAISSQGACATDPPPAPAQARPVVPHGPSGSGSTGNSAAGAGNTASSATPEAPAAASSSPAPNSLLANPAAFSQAHPDSAGIAGMALPILLIAGAALLVLGPAAMLLGGTSFGAAVQAQLRSVLRLR